MAEVPRKDPLASYSNKAFTPRERQNLRAMSVLFGRLSWVIKKLGDTAKWLGGLGVALALTWEQIIRVATWLSAR